MLSILMLTVSMLTLSSEGLKSSSSNVSHPGGGYPQKRGVLVFLVSTELNHDFSSNDWLSLVGDKPCMLCSLYD